MSEQTAHSGGTLGPLVVCAKMNVSEQNVKRQQLFGPLTSQTMVSQLRINVKKTPLKIVTYWQKKKKLYNCVTSSLEHCQVNGSEKKDVLEVVGASLARCVWVAVVLFCHSIENRSRDSSWYSCRNDKSLA